jgi:hypothetical protein
MVKPSEGVIDMYYSVKGYILNYSNPQQLIQRIETYGPAKLRGSAWQDGTTVHFESALKDANSRDKLAADATVFIDQYGGYIIFSECEQFPDGSIGKCTMTHRYVNDPAVTN